MPGTRKGQEPGKWAKYGRKYNKDWENESGLKDWIQPHEADNSKALCRFCQCALRAHHTDLLQHGSTEKHQRNSSMGLTGVGLIVSKQHETRPRTTRQRKSSALMSGRGDVADWVEATEVVVTEEHFLPPDNSAVLPVLEAAETPIDGDDREFDGGFYCEECQSLFQDQSDPSCNDGPSFILDSPTSVGVPQRALLTLPHGLMIGRSSIPSAGLGVINQGPAVSPGMHFGPYEGDVTTMENAMASDFSWEIYKGKDEFEYIDAARESHSNWMRYVNCARTEDETNLLAIQYKDSVLFHCCRTIHTGDELMVWPSSKLINHLSDAWTHIWMMKSTPTESNTTAPSQIFTCTHCQLSFTTEAYLQRHTELHVQPEEDDCTTAAFQAVEAEYSPTNADTEDPANSLMILSVNPLESKMCSECGKTFKHTHHLTRHKLNVHSNKRPYCCPHCRRSFSQASGLIRHQSVHRRLAGIKETPIVLSQKNPLSSPPLSDPSNTGGPTVAEDLTNRNKDMNESEKSLSAGGAETSQVLNGKSTTCPDCGKSFMCGGYLKKHRITVHGNVRPYVCTLCRQCFGQHSDLARHLKNHQQKRKRERSNKAPGETTTAPYCCDNCSLRFSSEVALQQHRGLHHSVEGQEDNPVQDQEDNPVPSDDDEGHDPDFIVPSLAKTAESIRRPLSQRPQRLGARSKISAITKLIAPKSRAAISKKTSTRPATPGESCSEPATPGESCGEPAVFTLRNSDGKSAKYSWYRRKGARGNADLVKSRKRTSGQHKCGQCEATFNTPGFLKRHERMVHASAETYSCDHCGKVFGKPSTLKLHQKAKRCEKHHCTSELFPCYFCQFSFTLKSYLRKHIKRHHPFEYVSLESENQLGPLEEEGEEKLYICPHCGKTYLSLPDYKAHTCFQQVSIHFLCTDCGKGFSNHYSLKSHQRIHTGEKPYSCPHCPKSFSYNGQLKVHIRTHTGEKPYLCTHCGESFRQSGDLKRHERKHTGVRPYNCPDCGKNFSRPQSLKAHQMIHLGQKKFKCTQCGKSFSRNYHLRRHHQKVHS